MAGNSGIHISVVIPVYGCADCLHELHEKLCLTLEKITTDFEIVMVNDASKDIAWEIITGICSKDIRVTGINLSKNFGQHIAIRAGLEASLGEWVVVMDCDLQDKPEEILNLYNKAKQGLDYVVGSRGSRRDNILKKASSTVFHKLLSYLSDVNFSHENSNFGIFSRPVIDNALRYNEEMQVLELTLQHMGFNGGSVFVEHQERQNGKSSYNFTKRFRLGMNLVLNFTDKPLRLLFAFGLFISFVSFCIGLFLVFDFYYRHKPVSGWTSLIVTIFFISGILFSGLGLIGLYIGKIFKQVKSRPLFIVKSRLNEHR
jgi:dolichol-phosphate mannosyltransferase